MVTTEPKSQAHVKLTIIKVEDKVTFNGTDGKPIEKLPFTAKAPDGHEYFYVTFKHQLFEHITEGAVIEADVEINYNNSFTNRKVTQIYENGQPIGGKKPFGGGGYRGSTPEDRMSIEKQVAAKIGAELMAAGIIPIDSELGKLTVQFCVEKLSQHVIAIPAPQPAVTQPAARPTAPAAPAPGKSGARTFANVGELFGAAVKELGLGRAESMEIIGVKVSGDILDFAEAWKKLLPHKKI